MKAIPLLIVFFPVTILLIIFSIILLNKSDSLNINKYTKDTPNKINTIIINDGKTDANTLGLETTPALSAVEDPRRAALVSFLTKNESPLLDYIDDLLYATDKYGIDFAMIPAIAMQESNGCKKIPKNSYNCWGYGIYGTKLTKFSSYKDAINAVAKTIKDAYIKDGLTNATLVEDRWAPPSKGQWSYGVNFFISEIKKLL